MAESKHSTITVKLPRELHDLAGAVAEVMQADARTRMIHGNVSRGFVIRHALVLGLERLAKEHGSRLEDLPTGDSS